MPLYSIECSHSFVCFWQVSERKRTDLASVGSVTVLSPAGAPVGRLSLACWCTSGSSVSHRWYTSGSSVSHLLVHQWVVCLSPAGAPVGRLSLSCWCTSGSSVSHLLVHQWVVCLSPAGAPVGRLSLTCWCTSGSSVSHLLVHQWVVCLSPAGALVGRLSGVHIDKITQTWRAKTQPVKPAAMLEIIITLVVRYGKVQNSGYPQW